MLMPHLVGALTSYLASSITLWIAACWMQELTMRNQRSATCKLLSHQGPFIHLQVRLIN